MLGHIAMRGLKKKEDEETQPDPKDQEITSLKRELLASYEKVEYLYELLPAWAKEGPCKGIQPTSGFTFEQEEAIHQQVESIIAYVRERKKRDENDVSEVQG